jgi:HSP20 family protein
MPETDYKNQQGQTGTATLEPPETHQTQATTGSPQAGGTSKSAQTGGASPSGSSGPGGGPKSGAQTGSPGISRSASGSGPSTGMARRGLTSPASLLGDPLGAMRSMVDQMDRLFDDFLGLSPFARHRPRGTSAALQGLTGGADLWYPQIEVRERDNNLVVCADLPGMRKEDVHLEVHDDYLVLSGERHQEQEQNEQGWYRSERSYGQFYRTVPLPEGVDANQAKASFKDGVLEVKIPLPPREQQPKGRRIEIQ